MNNPTTITISTEDQQLYWQLSAHAMRREPLQLLGSVYHITTDSFESSSHSFKATIVLWEQLSLERALGSIQPSLADYPDEVIIAEAYRRLKLKQEPDPHERIDRIKLQIDYQMSAVDVKRMLEAHPFLKEVQNGE